MTAALFPGMRSLRPQRRLFRTREDVFAMVCEARAQAQACSAHPIDRTARARTVRNGVRPGVIRWG